MEELGWGRRLLFGAIMGVFVLLCVELMLQTYYYVSAGAFLFERVHPPLMEADETRCYRLKPNLAYTMGTNEFQTTIYTNSQGLRTDSRQLDLPHHKPDDVYRIVFLGPSFTFGWGNDYENAFATLIGEGLQVPGKRVETLNLGTPAQGLEPQLCWLVQEGVRFDPDLVVTTVYGPELPPVPAQCPMDLRCPYLSPDGAIHARNPTTRARVIGALKNFATVFYGYYLVTSFRSAPPEDGVGIGKELYSEEERRTGGDPEAIAEGYQAFVDYVQANLGSQVEVAFLHLPLSYVVHPEDAARWSHILEASPIRARARIAAGVEASVARGLTVADTTPALIDEADERRMYYWLDIHLTPAGNRVVAESALPVLQERVESGVGAGPGG